MVIHRNPAMSTLKSVAGLLSAETGFKSIVLTQHFTLHPVIYNISQSILIYILKGKWRHDQFILERSQKSPQRQVRCHSHTQRKKMQSIAKTRHSLTQTPSDLTLNQMPSPSCSKKMSWCLAGAPDKDLVHLHLDIKLDQIGNLDIYIFLGTCFMNWGQVR